MIQISIVQGTARDYPIQFRNQGGRTTPVYAVGDTLSAVVYRGQSQAPLFAPGATWYTAGGTQTGYEQGQGLLTITAAQSALLERAGTYPGDVFWTAAAGGDSAAVARFMLTCLGAAGADVRPVVPYCTYDDLLEYATWLDNLQAFDLDQEGFYVQRVKARQWLDWIIARNWRGTSAAYFGDAGRSAQFWLGSWVRRTPLPSYWLLNQLAGGFAVNPLVTITDPGSYTAIPTVTAPDPPPGPGNATATFVASLDAAGGISSIGVSTPGQGYLPGQLYALTLDAPINCGGGGTASFVASSGTLMVRPQIVRACAYKAISLIGLTQIGQNNQYAAYGQHYADLASSELTTIVAELDLNGDGVADLPIPLYLSNTMFS